MSYIYSSISQMPLLPSNLGITFLERAEAYLESLYYLSLERIEKTGGYQHYVFTLNLTERKTETGTETMSTESDLTSTEKRHRRVFSQDFGRYSFLSAGDPKLTSKGITTSAILFQPMPQVLHRQIYVQPLKTVFPDEVYYVGIDETTLKSKIKDWINDPGVLDGYPSHFRLLRKQYTLSLTDTEKANPSLKASTTDSTFADQMSNRWFAGKTTIMLPGGVVIGELKETTTLNYDFTMVLHRAEGIVLSQTDCLAYFQCRARLHHHHIPITANSTYKKGRLPHEWTRQMAGHPMIALVRAEDQATDAAEFRDFAIKFIQAGQIDILDLTRIQYSKYNWDFMGDIEHFPPLLYVPAKWKTADWNKVKTDSGIRTGTTTRIQESDKEYFDRSRFTIYNPEELPLRFSYPRSRVVAYDSNTKKNLITTSYFRIDGEAIGMTENPPTSLDTVKVTYGVGGPVVLEFKVYLQKPLFTYVANHEVHAGSITGGVHTATYSGNASRLPVIHDRIWRIGNANLRTQANLFAFWKPSIGAYSTFTGSDYQITTPHPSYAVVKYDRKMAKVFEPLTGIFLSIDFKWMAKVWQESAFINAYWVFAMYSAGFSILPPTLGYRRNYMHLTDPSRYGTYFNSIGAISDTYQHEIAHCLSYSFLTAAEQDEFYSHPDEFYADLRKSAKFLWDYSGTFNRHSFFPGNLMHPGGGYDIITQRNSYSEARLTYEQVKLIQDKVS